MANTLAETLTDSGLIWKAGVPLRNLCHWKIGGPADYVIEPRSAEEAASARRLAIEANVPFLVIGHGSNMLFDDAGYRGAIIKLGSRMSRCRFSGTRVKAEAGIWAPALARACAGRGLTGLEHIVGIPGNLGGLLYMNGGSLRKNIGDAVVCVDILDEQGNSAAVSSAECRFSYRHSVFQEKKSVILGVELELRQSTPDEVRRNMLAVLKERREKFPLDLPNCGSVFSNEPRLYETYGPPGMVIEQTGLKGVRVGDAEISARHANFIVNRGRASSADVFALIRHVRRKVLERTGFLLHCEVCYAAPDGRCGRVDAFL